MAPIRGRSWFAVALAVTATLAASGFGAARPSAASGGWGKAVLLPGLTKSSDSQVSVISCSAPGTCVAAGSYGAGFAPTVSGRLFVVSQTRGAWGKPVTLPGLARTKEPAAAPADLKCFPSGNCVLVGGYKDAAGRSQAFITSRVHGTWSKISWVPGLASLDRGHSNGLNDLSCPAAGSCTAAGTYTDAGGASHPFVVAQVHGKWGSALPVPRLAGLPGQVAGTIPGLGPISCASAGNCALAGTYTVPLVNPDSGTNQAFIDNEVNGVWGTPEVVPGLAALNTDLVDSVDAIACPAPGDCSAGGLYTDSELGVNAFVVNETNGTWGPAAEVQTPIHANWIDSMSCPSVGNCVAGGPDNVDEDSLSSSAFIVTETKGTWGEGEPVPGINKLNAGDQAWLNQISCSSVGNCGVAGFTSIVYGFGFIYTQPFVVNQIHGKWGQARLVPGISIAKPNDGQAAATTAISCTGPAQCSAGGYYQLDNGTTHAFVVSRP